MPGTPPLKHARPHGLEHLLHFLRGNCPTLILWKGKSVPANDQFDVAIIGAGPAGLSAAIVLGRCRRSVIVIDDDRPRNRVAQAVNGFLGADGLPPAELRARGREQAAHYGVEYLNAEVTSGERYGESGFRISIKGHDPVVVRKVLLATGVRDSLPEIAGFDEFYGKTIHHCPYCDGWEHRDKRLVALGESESAAELAISLLTWSDRVTCCTHGHSLTEKYQRRLADVEIAYRPERIEHLAGQHGQLERLIFAERSELECDALFFSDDQFQRSPLPAQLGCESDHEGLIRTREKQRTTESGIFLAGDAGGYVQFAIVAAAEGAAAAVAINQDLHEDDIKAMLQARHRHSEQDH